MSSHTTKTTHEYARIQLSRRAHTFADWGEIAKRISCDPTFDGAFAGSYSITLRSQQHTFVASHHQWLGVPVSASAVCRLVLGEGLKLLGRKRILWNTKSKFLLDVSHPLYCQPTERIEELIYLDIKGAYFNIYRRMPFDIKFQGLRVYGGELYFKNFLPPDWGDFKIARNAMIGIMRSKISSRVKDGKIKVSGNRNIYLAPCHWGFIAHLLHTIAHKAISLGALYWNIDGAIFRSADDAIRFGNWLNDLGFESAIKAHGMGQIFSIGNYQVGTSRGGCVNPRPAPYTNLIEPSPYVLQRWVEWM